MQRLLDGRLRFSPSDLTRFHESPFAAWCARASLDDRSLQPVEDPAARVFQKYGDAHERRLLARMHELGLTVVEIPAPAPAAAVGAEAEGSDERDPERARGEERARQEEQAREATLAAIAAAPDVIYQARLEAGPFAGWADFLVHPRVAAWVRGAAEAADATGAAAGPYEVWDAKLARSVKATHPIQLCAYAELLEAMAGPAQRAERLVVALGDGSFAVLRRDEYAAYYDALRARFLASIEGFDPSPAGRPVPQPGQEHREWSEHAAAMLEELDHVSRVAFLRADQAKKLAKAGITTLSGLAETPLERVPRLSGAAFARLREQAALQRDSRGLDRPCYRVLGPDEVAEGKGLASLPPASPGDVYFDLEGFPLSDGPLEYLWGAAYPAPAEAALLEAELAAGAVLVEDAQVEERAVLFRAWWAHDAEAERRACDDFLEWVATRRERHPDLHVYHYAPYERTALTRIQARAGEREDELDVMLREGVLVDLYAVVRHGLRVGEPRYGIKNVERLYRPSREGAVADAMQSVVAYEEWLESGEAPSAAASPLLEDIRKYNEDDCVSTLQLAAWLRARQEEAGIDFAPPARVAPGGDDERAARRTERRAAQRALAARLRDAAGPEPPAAADPAARRRWRIGRLLARLVEYHHRELRPQYWQLHDRADATEEERHEASDCLAGLVRTGLPPYRIKNSYGYEYRFDPEQDSKVRAGTGYRVAQARELSVAIHALDERAGRATLKVTDSALAKFGLDELPERCCVVEFAVRSSEPLENGIARIAEHWLADHELPPALRDFLERRRPRVRGDERAEEAEEAEGNGRLRRPDEPFEAALHRLVGGLEGSCLVVQGPPGSGKTTLGARVIHRLAQAGRTVGISANSHKVVLNLMSACGRVAREAGGTARLLKVGGQGPDERDVPGEGGDAAFCQSGAAVGPLSPGTIVGGTAWCFADPGLRGRIDTLVVDEAGQVPLANLVAMAGCARNLLLLGDPAQLAQPLRGHHEGESGMSALEYALADTGGLVDERRGLFLADTWRLHPALCDFVSRQFYAGRLRPAAGNEQRVLEPRAALDPRTSLLGDTRAGLVFLPVAHEGSRQSSPEEVQIVERVVAECTGATLRGIRGVPGRDDEADRAIGPADILVVAPYNAQVHRLQQALPDGVEVGTVDKFQGREAPIVVVSLCASDAGLAPRGLSFLLSRNRVNVAVSRGQCLAVVVGSPALADAGTAGVEGLRASGLMAQIVARTRPT